MERPGTALMVMVPPSLDSTPPQAAQLCLHSLDAVALFDAEPLRVPDDGGPLAQQAQHHQHGAKVGAVGKVDVRAVERRLLEDDALPRCG